MKRSILLLPSLLAACHSSPSITADNASVGEVATKVAAATAGGALMAPGHWDGTVTIDDMQVPGMTPDMAKVMKAHLGGARPISSCLTPEQAKQPKGSFFGGQDNQACRYDHFSMSGGKIDAVMTCVAQGVTQTMTMTGSYSPDAYHMQMTSAGKGPSPEANVSMKMTLDAKRTGACTGKEDAMTPPKQ